MGLSAAYRWINSSFHTKCVRTLQCIPSSPLSLSHFSPPPSPTIDPREHGGDQPLTRTHGKMFSLFRSKFSCLSFICLFLLDPISTIKPFTSLLQFAFLKYLSEGIIVCRGQLLCSIIYYLLTRWKLLPRMHQYAYSQIQYI